MKMGRNGSYGCFFDDRHRSSEFQKGVCTCMNEEDEDEKSTSTVTSKCARRGLYFGSSSLRPQGLSLPTFKALEAVCISASLL